MALSRNEEKRRLLMGLPEPKQLSNEEIKDLLMQAPQLVQIGILRGWIKPPKFQLTSAQIASLARR
jgi:hypothetical protein